MKTRQDIDLTDRVGVFYAENDTELLWPIRLGVDWMKTRYENYVTDCIVRSMSKMKLSYRVQFVMKIKHDDLTDHISLVYAKIETELSWPIWPCVVMMKTK